ncbi:hypothetical protein S40288_10730 [Stachybotrys chartarum IBT 40288]|nr:hypothetical protein S40288_10730 [Stachybotrys chartarum IBT 40288]
MRPSQELTHAARQCRVDMTRDDASPFRGIIPCRTGTASKSDQAARLEGTALIVELPMGPPMSFALWGGEDSGASSTKGQVGRLREFGGDHSGVSLPLREEAWEQVHLIQTHEHGVVRRASIAGVSPTDLAIPPDLTRAQT